MPLANAGPLADPFVRGIDGARQFVVGHDTLWEIAADAGENGTNGHLISNWSRDGQAVASLRSPSFLSPPLRFSSRNPREIFADVVIEPVHHHVHRDIDGMGEAFGVGAAMRLYHDSVQPDHDGAVITPGVEPLTQPVEARPRDQIGDLGGDAAGEHVPQQVADQLQRAFAGLQRDVAGEAVGDDDVGGAGGNVVALDEAVETRADVAGAQDFRSLADSIVAFHFFHADIQQTDRRGGQAEHGAGKGVAHDGELDQVARVAPHVGAEVQHDHVAAGRGSDPRHRRPVDPRQRLEHDLRRAPATRRYCRPRPRPKPLRRRRHRSRVASRTGGCAPRRRPSCRWRWSRRRDGWCRRPWRGDAWPGAAVRAASSPNTRKRAFGWRSAASSSPSSTMSGALSPPMASIARVNVSVNAKDAPCRPRSRVA